MMDIPAELIISLDHFTIGYQPGSSLLRALNLTVKRGEMVSLIGRNGTGKSTLLKSMIGLLTPLDGECKLDGLPLRTYSLPERARRISFVSSHLSQLPTLTVEELVGMGRMPYTGWMGRLTSKDKSLVQHALIEVQMAPYAKRKLECLSDGERQRAMIARAFVQDTPLMVLDEPTAFLDIPNTFELIRLLSKFRDDGKSIVFSTHDLETAMQHADKMWVIHQENVLEGAPEDLGISGVFNEIFSPSGISYNVPNGKFLMSGTKKGRVELKGEQEELRNWTRNAIRRLGFEVEGGAEIKIVVTSAKGRISWFIEKDGASHHFEDIYSLARFLIQE
jgi:iron complex transport system ATP-binding protein